MVRAPCVRLAITTGPRSISREAEYRDTFIPDLVGSGWSPGTRIPVRSIRVDTQMGRCWMKMRSQQFQQRTLSPICCGPCRRRPFHRTVSTTVV